MHQNETVQQITCSETSVYGLTKSGQLVMFDREANSWVLRCQANILTVDKANVLKAPDTLTVEPVRFYVPLPEEKDQRMSATGDEELVWIMIGFASIAILVFLVVKLNIF